VRADEVLASVKPHKPGDTIGSPVRILPNRFTATNYAPRGLITLGYQLQLVELVGDPAWMTDERYDVDMTFDPADGPRAPIDAPYRVALRGLLAQRFKLALHREMREIPTYSLVLDRADRRLGKSLRPSSRVCGGTFQSNIPLAAGERPCGVFGGGGAVILGDAISMQVLAKFLGSHPGVRRIVVDRTGLSGTFDLDLSMSLTATPAADDQLPDVFTALKEQLGLALVPSNSPVEVTVVDHVERPSEN
jgi:uncharacterized protein (TIGR03435 family)